MKDFVKFIRDFVKAILFGFALAVGIFVCAIVWLKVEDNKRPKEESKYEYKYDSLVRMNALKDKVIVGQMKARKELEHKNDSLKRVLKIERICVGRYLYPKKKHNQEIKTFEKRIVEEQKDLLNIIVEQKSELAVKDSLLVEITNMYNGQNK